MILDTLEDVSKKPQVLPGEQLYAVLAAACLDKKETVNMVLMSYIMLASMKRQAEEPDENGDMQYLLLNYMSAGGEEEGGASMGALGLDAMKMIGITKKDAYIKFLNTYALSTLVLQKWPCSINSAKIKALAAKLMGVNSIPFQTTLHEEHVSWEVLLAPFRAAADETVQGSMCKLVHMMDYESLKAWCAYASPVVLRPNAAPETVNKPQDSVIFVDDLSSRNKGITITDYDKQLLKQNENQKVMSIQYGIFYMLVNSKSGAEWTTVIKKRFSGRLFHANRKQQMSAARVLALARVNCPVSENFFDGSFVMDKATEDLVCKFKGGGYSISPYVVWKKLACIHHPPEEDCEMLFSPQKILECKKLGERIVFEFEDEWLDMQREGSISFDIFFMVSFLDAKTNCQGLFATV